MMFKYSLGIVPKPITLFFFTRNDEIHNTRYSNLLHPMIGRTEATYKTFRFQAILIWNNIFKQIHINQGRSQDLLQGRGGARNFLQIWKFACRTALC